MKMVTVEDFPDHILELIFSFLSPYAELDACMKLQFNFRELRNLEWFPVDQLYSTECANIWSRFAHAACYHKSGSIYVFGGMTSTFGFLNDIWKFNLTTRVWKRLPSNGDLPRPKASSSLIAYGDKLILFGGWCPSQWRACRPGNVFCDNLHSYCISTGAWTSIPSRGTRSEPLANHSASLIGDWMILFGGLTPSGCTNKISVFDIRRKAWFFPLTSPIRPSPRCLHSQVILDDEHLLIVGGECMGKTNLFDVWLLTVGHENTIWQWEQLDVFTNEPSLPLLWSRQACKVGDKAIFLSCPHVERSAAQFQAAQTFFGINRSGSGRNDFRVFDRHDYSLPFNRLSTVKMDAKPQVPATGRTQKRTDSSRKKENWKVGIPCTRPVNVYALHMDRVMSHRCVTWSIVPSSSHAPQDTFLGSVIEGRGEIVVFGGVRYVGDSSSPSFSSFFEQKHGAAVDTVFVLKSSLGKSIKPSSTYPFKTVYYWLFREEQLTVVPDLIDSGFLVFSGNMGTVKPICAVSEETRSQINQFRNKRCSGTCALILKIHQATHQLELEEHLENVSIEQLRDSLPDIVPRFVLLCRRLVHSDEHVSFPLLVIFFSPYGCTATMQMLYAGSLNLVLCESRIHKYIEVRELEELTESSIDESLNCI